MPPAIGPPDQEALEDTRNEIRVLQGEYQKKKEDLERKERQRKQSEDELNRRQDRLARLEIDLAHLNRRALKDRETDGIDQASLVDQARLDFMDTVVGDVLKRRVPLMAETAGLGSEADVGRSDAKDTKTEDQQKNSLHDTVLVSYVVMGADDYQVAYRIHKDTTVDQLHRDACSYWGCSHLDYVLCKTNAREEAEQLWDKDDRAGRRHQKLQQDDLTLTALDPSEMAQLHLVSWTDLEAFQLSRKKLKEQEPKLLQEMQAREKGNEANTIKTLKHGFGFASNEAIMEPYIEALRQWPGLYQMLRQYKTRPAARDQKWTRIRPLDLLLLVLLITLTIACYGLRSSHGSFTLRTGVVEMLGVGVEKRNTDKPPPAFNDVALHGEIWDWFGGIFIPALYDKDSTLRQYYQPIGFVRLRQQRAKSTDCAERKILAALTQTCFFVEVNDDTQEKNVLKVANDKTTTEFFAASSTSGRQATPNPLVWNAASGDSFDVYGYLQHTYDGSGYMIEYNTDTNTGTQFMKDLKFFELVWVGPQTRLLVVELTLANYNLEGYVAVNFLFELGPGGIVKPNIDVMSFSTTASWRWDVASGFDIVRWIIVVGYLFLWRLYFRTKAKVSLGKNRFSYMLSMSGITDIISAGLFIATQVFLLKGKPPAPERQTAFYSYTAFAHDLEVIDILESTFLFVCLIRMASFARMSPTVFRYFKVFSRSFGIMLYYMSIFVPALCGLCLLAHAVWSPYLDMFSTYTNTFMSVLLAIYQPFVRVQDMNGYGNGWALPFLFYFTFGFSMFLLYVFLAIIVHSYWEVQLIERDSRIGNRWSADQWLDWALWGPVYTRLTGRKPGSSRIKGYTTAERDDSSSSSSDSEEER